MQRLTCFQRGKLTKVISGLQLLLGVLVVLSLTSLVKLYSSGFFVNDANNCKHFYIHKEYPNVTSTELFSKLQDMKKKVDGIQNMIEKSLEEMHGEGSEEPKAVESERLKFSTVLAEILVPVDSIKIFLDQIRLPGVHLVPQNADVNTQLKDPIEVAGTSTDEKADRKSVV